MLSLMDEEFSRQIMIRTALSSMMAGVKPSMTSSTWESRYGRLVLGFPVPPHDGMQNLTRMKFLHDTILRFAERSSGVALEVGCFMGGSTVFLAKACLRKGISDIYAMDLFSGWECGSICLQNRAKGWSH